VLTSTPNVVVVPFFISDGLHSYEDIPRLLGIADRTGEEVFRRRPYRIDDRSLFYGRSIGTDPRVADIILEQANAATTATDSGN
jgi:sirohydrochlorin cobaltochelatase